MNIVKIDNLVSSRQKTHVKPIESTVIEATYDIRPNFYEIIEKRLGDAESIRTFWFCAGITTGGLVAATMIILSFLMFFGGLLP